ncbi:MAG: WYL domain-containing protein [Bacteroidia bacterium]
MLQIITAIENRLVLQFKYRNDTYRKVDTYILGLNANGEMYIRCFEINEGWKLFKVSEMTNLWVASTKVYGHKSGYKSNDAFFSKVIKKVK